MIGYTGGHRDVIDSVVGAARCFWGSLPVMNAGRLQSLHITFLPISFRSGPQLYAVSSASFASNLPLPKPKSTSRQPLTSRGLIILGLSPNMEKEALTSPPPLPTVMHVSRKHLHSEPSVPCPLCWKFKSSSNFKR